MRILGIDPGVAITGFALVEESGSDINCLNSGCIRTGSELPSAERLGIIHRRVLELVTDYKPRVLVVEKIFFSKNVRTAFQVGEARGVVLLASALAGIELFEYTPLQVKQAVAGYGGADKEQVQNMVRMLLRLNERPVVDDEADAMAVALCYLQNRRFHEAVRRRS